MLSQMMFQLQDRPQHWHAIPVPAAAPTGENPRAVVVAPKGGYVYVASHFSDSIWAYAIDGASRGLRRCLAAVYGWQHPRGLAIDSATLLYCTNYGANTVSAYRINPITGVLNEIPGSPYSTGDGPFGIAIF